MTEGPPDGVVIRTPDQRLRVFVSSTLGELAAERQAVACAIAAARLTLVMFEAGARPHPAGICSAPICLRVMLSSGLYWQRYGQVDPGMAVSGLEEEFELSAGLPRLLYVTAPALEREPRLAGLLARIKEEASYWHFGTPAELGRLVRDDLAALLSERFAAARRVRGPGGLAWPAAAAGERDVVARAGAGHRRGDRPAGAAGGAAGDADRAGRGRQDPAGGGRWRTAPRPF
jgi:hypothetical protein